MALIDDIEFYGSRVDAGDIDRQEAARLLAEASHGGLTLRGALHSIDTWQGIRARFQQLHADVVDTLRAVQNGRPVPEHVRRSQQERATERARSIIRRSYRDGEPWPF